MNSGGKMKHLVTLIVGITLLLSMSVSAASAHLEGMAERLASQAEELAGRSYNGFSDRDRGNRADVEVLYLTQQFSAAASLFRRMLHDRRPDSELRDAVDILSDVARSSERFAFARREWDELQRTLDEIARELNMGRFRRDDEGARWNDNDSDSHMNGRMRWRGRVDNEVYVVVQRSNASIRMIAGSPVKNASSNFTAPLPRRALTVEVKKLKGRGSVEIIQQPSRDNDYTAIIQVKDNKGEAADYEFELSW